MRKVLLVILFLLLIACSPQVTVTSEVTATLTPLPTATSIPTPTEVPLESLPVEELARKYMAGEIDDISFLDNEQRAQFSLTVAELKNEQAGINFVSFTYLKGEKYYLNPETLAMEKMPSNPDDAFLKENSFEIYLPVTTDAQGNVMYLYNEEWHTVSNSTGFDFRMRITDPNHPIVTGIDMPKITEGEFAGMTPLQKTLIDQPYDYTIVPVVPLKESVGKITLESGPAFSKLSIFKIMTFETDSHGQPILAKVSLILPSGAFSLYEEGEAAVVKGIATFDENHDFWIMLEENQLYYVTIANNPQEVIGYNLHSSTNNVAGISFDNTQTNEISLVLGFAFIKRKD